MLWKLVEHLLHGCLSFKSDYGVPSLYFGWWSRKLLEIWLKKHSLHSCASNFLILVDAYSCSPMVGVIKRNHPRRRAANLYAHAMSLIRWNHWFLHYFKVWQRFKGEKKKKEKIGSDSKTQLINTPVSRFEANFTVTFLFKSLIQKRQFTIDQAHTFLIFYFWF